MNMKIFNNKIINFTEEKDNNAENYRKNVSQTQTKLKEKEVYNTAEMLLEKEKLQDAIENYMKTKDIDDNDFKELMKAYGKKYSHYEPKQIEDLLNTRKVESVSIMKGIGDIKHKIDYLDLKEAYLDSFLGIGKFDQGATLVKIK